MAPPLYFFPKLTRGQLAPDGVLSQTLLRSRGLERTFCDVTDLRRQAAIAELTGPGPGGHSGCLFCALPAAGDPPPRLHYAPEFQTWTEVGPELYVGTDNEHPITAADLRRKQVFEGYDLELAGQTWKVPVIRDPEGGTWLPRIFAYDDGGKVVQRIRETYLALWERFARAVWLFFDPEGPWPLRMDLTEATDLCLDALSLNYRVGRIEQNLLGLIDSENWYMILAAAVDYFTHRDVAEAVEAQKKTLAADRLRCGISPEIPPSPASIATLPGPADGCPGTAPAGANCGSSPSATEPIPDP